MRLKVDHTRCEGYASCVIDAPELFELGDEDNLAYVLLEQVPDALGEKARKAVRECPTRAISIEDD
jgi:ferredoxin